MARQPSRPDGRYSLVEADSEVQSEAAEVRAMHRTTVTVPVALIVASITAFAGVAATYIQTHSGKVETPPQLLTRDYFEESMRIRDAQNSARFNSLETNVSLLIVRTDPGKK